MTGRDPLPDTSDPDLDSSLGATEGDDISMTDGEPLPDDQGGLSTDDGSQSDWDTPEDLSIADGDRDSAQPNDGQPVTNDYGHPDPTPDPGPDAHV